MERALRGGLTLGGQTLCWMAGVLLAATQACVAVAPKAHPSTPSILKPRALIEVARRAALKKAVSVRGAPKKAAPVQASQKPAEPLRPLPGKVGTIAVKPADGVDHKVAAQRPSSPAVHAVKTPGRSVVTSADLPPTSPITRHKHAASREQQSGGDDERRRGSKSAITAQLANPWLSVFQHLGKINGAQPARPLRSTSPHMVDLRVYEPQSAELRLLPIDPSLQDLLARLRVAVAKSDTAPLMAALAPDLVMLDCSGDATLACPATTAVRASGRRRASPARLGSEERLLRAMCCADMRPHDVPKHLRQDAVLDLLASTLENNTLAADPDMPDVVCSPAQPVFDREKAAGMAAAADTETQNLRIATKELVVRRQPNRDAVEAARIAPRRIVPLVTDLPNPLPDGWSAVALPEARLGYLELKELEELVPANSACFKKNEAGTWQIHAIVRRHSWGGLG